MAGAVIDGVGAGLAASGVIDALSSHYAAVFDPVNDFVGGLF